MKDFTRRPDDVSKAVRMLRKEGVRIGLPMQSADGQMIFPVEDFTLSAGEILDLLDKQELNRSAIQLLKEVQRTTPPGAPPQSGSKL
jgi:hypothetical protein